MCIHRGVKSTVACAVIILVAVRCTPQPDVVGSPPVGSRRDGDPPGMSAEPRPMATAVALTKPVKAGNPADDTRPRPVNTSTPTPLSSATPQPSPSPVSGPALHQFTTGGCCTRLFWSPDSRQVLFIDKPAPDAPVGIWGVDIKQPGSPPELVTERIGFYTTDFKFVVEL